MDLALTSLTLDEYILGLQKLALVVGALISLFSLDDLVVDVWYWLRQAWRALYIRPRYKPLPIDALYDRAEQPIAIMIPAWREDDVIAAMIENTVNVTD